MKAPICNKPLQIAQGRQSGLALVIVIWILTLLTLMAGSFAMTMRRDTSVSTALKTSAEALATAEGGIMLAEFMLTQNDPALRWLADGTVYRLPLVDGELRVRISSETGKVDINTSSETQLSVLLSAFVKDEWQQQQLLNAILDWRDADEDTRTQGAEKRQYQRAGLSYGPSNAAFQNVEELQLVLGMNESIYTALQPFITVYSGQSEVNLKTANPQLLWILSSGLKKRNIQDQALENRLEQSGADPNELENTDLAVEGEGQTYTLLAEAILHGEAASGVEVVVQQQASEVDGPFQVLDWKQNLQGISLFDDTMDDSLITVQDEFRYDDRY